eukprot:jgi/Ulvmu1/4498/UM002_0224.1
MSADPVRDKLDEECGRAHAVALTQASEFGSTQRIAERDRTRGIVLKLREQECLAHIKSCPIDAAAVKRFSLIVYSLSHVLPTDTPQTMTACKHKLEKYLLAILRRVKHLEVPDRWMQQLGRISGTALEDISPTGLESIADMSLEALSSGSQAAPHLLGLLSASLSHLLRRPKTEEEKVYSTAKVHNVIKRLCETPWPSHLIQAIVMHLRNAGLPEAIIQTASAAVSSMCATVEPEYLSEAIYGLLTLPSTATVTHINSVCVLMATRRADVASATDRQALAAAEAATLQRVVDLFAIEKSLTNQWLKAFKAEQRPTQFAVSLTLMLAGGSRAGAGAFDAVKAVLMSSLKHAEAAAGSPWLQSLPCDQGFVPQELAELLFATVRDANEGLAAQLTQLGFHLAGSAKLKQVAVETLESVSQEQYEGLQWWGNSAAPSAQLCLAGVALLDQVARFHTVHVEPILEHLCAQLVGGTAVEAVLQYLLILRCVFGAQDQALSAHVPAVQGLLEGVLAMSNEISVVALSIMWPFCHRHKSLRKIAVSHLRHAQKVHDVSARLCATQGFIVLILHSIFSGEPLPLAEESQAFNWSQLDPMYATQAAVSMSQLPGISTEATSLLTDFMGFLRRSVSQQAPVRKALYNGLSAIMASDETSAPSIFTLLAPQLQQYVQCRDDAVDMQRKYRLDVTSVASVSADVAHLKDALPELVACIMCVLSTGNDVNVTGLKHVNTVCHSVFFQLSDLSLEEMGIENVEDIVWKSADGLKNQMWGYSLLGALDAAVSHYLPMVLDHNASNRSAKAVTAIISSYTRLGEFLHGASRPKALKDVASNKVSAAASADELAMLPADSKSVASYVSTPALLLCFHAMSGTGRFQDEAEVPGPALELMRSPELLEHALRAAEAQLSNAIIVRRNHGDLVAVWAAQPDVQRACGQMLGVPEWRELVQPVLRGSLAVVKALSAPDSEEEEDAATLVPAAVQCICASLELASHHGCIVDLLAALPDAEEDTSAALQGRTPAEACGGTGGAAETAAQRLPLLFAAARQLAQGRCFKQLEHLCCALRVLRGPAWLTACTASWPLVLAADHQESMVGHINAGAADSLLQLALAGDAATQEALIAHAVQVCVDTNPRQVPQNKDTHAAQLRVKLDDRLQRLCVSCLSEKTQTAVTGTVLSILMRMSGSVQWLCKVLEGLLGQKELQPDDVVRAVKLEKAAAERIELLALLLADFAETLGAHTEGKVMDAFHRACKEAVKAADGLFKALLAPKSRSMHKPGKHVLEAAAAVSHDLVQSIYSILLLNKDDADQNEPPAKKARAHKQEIARAKREASVIPDVIFWIESFEADCLKLSKACKCSIIKGLKRTVTRDFKIM